MALLGLVLLYVGAVLIINGLSLMGKIAVREAAVMNIFTGVVSLAVSYYSAFTVADTEGVKNAALGLLFGFTYLWVAYNSLMQTDGRGLGWFSLFVAITVLPVFFMEIAVAETLGGYWLAINWAVWSVLWLSFFALNVLNKETWRHKIGVMTVAQGVVTAWIPGFLLLFQKISVYY